jgi:hypothetical protein
MNEYAGFQSAFAPLGEVAGGIGIVHFIFKTHGQGFMASLLRLFVPGSQGHN